MRMASTLTKFKETAAKIAEECQIKNPERLPLFKFLYQSAPESSVEKSLHGIEKVTRLKREQVFCVVLGVFAAFFFISYLPHVAVQLMGVMYPLYATVWTIRSNAENPELLKSWLSYWAVYGAFILLDSVFLPVLANVTVYWLAKIVFMFYLVCTQPLGSSELLEKGLYPAIDKMNVIITRLFDGSAVADAPPRKNSKKK